MKRAVYHLLPLTFATTLLACSDDNAPDFFRTSAGVATEALQLYLEAEVHTHPGEGEAPDETHTTVQVELYGYDHKGYFYNIELGAGDTLAAGINGAIAPMTADYFPDNGEPISVLYYRDFDTIAGGTVFDVVLDRDRDAALHELSVTLPPEANFAVAPATASVDPGAPLSFSWSETAEHEYTLSFRFNCTNNSAETVYQSHVRFPNWSVETIASPFSFTPSNFFSPSDTNSFTECTLSSTLKTYSNQDPESQAPFSALHLRSARRQTIEQNINLL